MKKALILVAVIILTGLCGCSNKPANENYFGGEGELKAEDFLIYDENNVYINLGYTTLKKYSKSSGTLSIACDDPGCGHNNENVNCKARMDYCLFNGDLIRIHNETVMNADGTSYSQGYLYLCGESEKQVFKNALPEGMDSEKNDPSIGTVFTLGDDYLVLFNGGYMYILDSDFNIKYTVTHVGSYTGGVYYVDDEIYYIDDLYRLMKLDNESGEGVPVNIGAKVTEGFVVGNVLWFSNEKMALCSYDLKTGELEEHAQNAVRLSSVGKYIEYMVYDTGDVCLYNTESNEISKRENLDINADELFFLGGDYYAYNDTNGTLTLYEDDLTTVKSSCVLEE